jgi:hypothetical protein
LEELSGSRSSVGNPADAGDCLARVIAAFQLIGVVPRKVAPLRVVPVAAAIVPLGWVVYNPDVVCGLSDAELLALMAHEAYHLTMRRSRSRLLRAVLLSVLKIGLALDVALVTIVLGILLGLGIDNPFLLAVSLFAGLIGSSQIFPKLVRLGVPIYQEEIEANSFAAAVAGTYALHSLFKRLSEVRGPQAVLLKLLRGF